MGNIDYVWRWYWVDADGKVQHDKGALKGAALPHEFTLVVPDELRQFHPRARLQRTWIGDNDAGLSRRYANFSAQTGMVSNLRHFDAGVYRRLRALSHDFQQRGPMSDFLAGENGLKPAQLELMMKNTIDVAAHTGGELSIGKAAFRPEPDEIFERRAHGGIGGLQRCRRSDMNLADICCPFSADWRRGLDWCTHCFMRYGICGNCHARCRARARNSARYVEPDADSGEKIIGEKIVELPVPGRKAEICVVPTLFDGASYSTRDTKVMEQLCVIHVRKTAAVCPKLNSTNLVWQFAISRWHDGPEVPGYLLQITQGRKDREVQAQHELQLYAVPPGLLPCLAYPWRRVKPTPSGIAHL